jgi:hypothetical protein
MNILFVVLIIIILFVIIYILIKNEPFAMASSRLQTSEPFMGVSNSNVIKTNQLSSDLPTTAISPVQMITDDTLFDDVTMIRGDGTLTGELGLEKCIKTCKGMCVEYGVTGDAFCFPSADASNKEKYTKTVKEKYSFKF